MKTLILLVVLVGCKSPNERNADANERNAEYLKEIAAAVREVNASLLIGPSMISELYDKLHECQNQIGALQGRVEFLEAELGSLHAEQMERKFRVEAPR